MSLLLRSDRIDTFIALWIHDSLARWTYTGNIVDNLIGTD